MVALNSQDFHNKDNVTNQALVALSSLRATDLLNRIVDDCHELEFIEGQLCDREFSPWTFYKSWRHVRNDNLKLTIRESYGFRSDNFDQLR